MSTIESLIECIMTHPQPWIGPNLNTLTKVELEHIINELDRRETANRSYAHQVGNAYGGPICILVNSDEGHCGCKGNGWHLTDYDTYHKCPVHYDGQQHPECY